ncbi:MAG: helicase HerA-like domain-containing protein [Bradyrhizobium sp.]|nr:helicase HerA-like domain-containing protein [Bradyrhizobium sp.]
MAPSGTSLGDTDDKIFVGGGEQPAWLTLAFAKRHGLVTGATGTGKTVSLQVMAEGFARAVDVGYEMARFDLLTKINQTLNRDGGALAPAPVAQEAVS